MRPALGSQHLTGRAVTTARQPNVTRKTSLNVFQSGVHPKEDFAMNHPPLQSFLANWLWWQASTLAYKVARWVRVLVLREPFSTCRGKRLRASFFNVPACVVRSGRRIHLRLPRAYLYADSYIAALKRLRALPLFA